MIIAVCGAIPAVVATISEALASLGVQVRSGLDHQVQAVVADEPDAETIVKLRDHSETMPILALGRAEGGAVEAVMAKPLRLAALYRQLERLVDHNGQNLGPWRFFAKIRRLQGPDGQIEHLTEKESDLLDYMLRAGGLVTRDDILADVFGYGSQVSTHTVETHIHTLRKKLGADLLSTEEDGYLINQA